ncbi:MAG TPA: hypothetical protein PLU43_10685 [Lachnospiraceae bacterium]|nr:hypothetical protein [Lachnospiraceae bacterium]
MKDPLFKKRLFMALSGVLICGISVGLFRRSVFGTDPFQVLVNGLSNQITVLDFGTLYMIINLLMLAAVFFLDKHYIGVATFINIFLLGYVVQFSDDCIGRLLGDSLNLVTRIILLTAGIIIMCFASSLYFTADLGVSTYDSISLIMTDKKLGKFKYLRIGTDLFCVIVGFILGGIVGIGTVVTAFFMGPLIDFFNKKAARPFLYGKNSTVQN